MHHKPLRCLLFGTFLLSSITLCAASCKKEPRGSTTPTSSAPATDVDLLLQGLTAPGTPDEQHFALYFISHFGLQGYRDEVAALAATNVPLAAAVLSGTYADNSAADRLLEENTEGAAFDSLTGAVYGLRNAAEMPPAFWLDCLEEAATLDADRLWSLAVLDTEPGGPLQRSEALIERFEELHKRGLEENMPGAVTALDALLGSDGAHQIDWAYQSTHAPQLKLQSSQWQALMRHGSTDRWKNMHSLLGKGSAEHIAFLQAAAAAAPGGYLPDAERADLQLNDSWLEYDVLMFAAGKTETINAEELQRLLTSFHADAQDKDDEAVNMELLLRICKYAALRRDLRAINALVDSVPIVQEDCASGILATLERYGRDQITDAHLASLAESRDRTVGYWLLFGWSDRAAVRENSIVRLVLMSPNQENKMLFQAYSHWLEQEGIIKPEAAGAT